VVYRTNNFTFKKDFANLRKTAIGVAILASSSLCTKFGLHTTNCLEVLWAIFTILFPENSILGKDQKTDRPSTQRPKYVCDHTSLYAPWNKVLDKGRREYQNTSQLQCYTFFKKILALLNKSIQTTANS
jgi:hypothetical protein